MSENKQETEKRIVYEGRLHAWLRTGAVIVCVVLVIVMFSNVMASITKLTDDADGLVVQADVVLQDADEALMDANAVIGDVKKAVGNMNDVLEIIKEADLASVIDSLHNAVDNLNTVIKPLAKIVSAASFIR